MVGEIENLEKILKWYLVDICSRFGFCLVEEQKEDLLDNPGNEVAQFVERIMIFEGLDPKLYKDHYKDLYELLISRVGGEAFNLS